MDRLMCFADAIPRAPAVDAWFDEVTDPLRLLVQPWFERMRASGPDVRELMHDGCPVVCVGEAAFAYVNAFRSHAAVGFFRGASLPDPAAILEGTGKRMRHVKIRPGARLDAEALEDLIGAAYRDMRERVTAR